MEGCSEVSLKPSFLQAEQFQFPQPYFTGEVLQTFGHLCGPLMDPLQQLCIPRVLGTSGLVTVLQVGPHEGRAEGDIPLPLPASHHLLANLNLPFIKRQTAQVLMPVQG